MLLTCICIILNAKGGNFATDIVECAILSTSIILKTISAIAFGYTESSYMTIQLPYAF